jgi:hypothetical protein
VTADLHALVAPTLVLACAWWWLRRRRGGLPGAPGRRTSVGLGPAHALHVVELEGRRLLVGTGPSGAPALLLDLGEGTGSL